MTFNLRPKNIIVVGGTGGIGFSTAEKLILNGAENIILASRNPDKLIDAQEKLKKLSENVHIIEFDITDTGSHKELIDKARELTGRVPDGLVISSGVNFDGGNWKGFNISEEDWDRVMDTNLKGVFFLMRNFSNYLFGNKVKGNICIVSSISAHRDFLSVYQVSKNAISGIVHTYGKYLCERGIVLNCVEPGQVYTDMMKHLSVYTDGVKEGKPYGENSIHRLVRADEIAEIICFLMSDLGEVMSGSCILAGGGTKGLFR
ncbi:MAG: SDR family NAD(P)-dependent oxidoreductase [Ruminiclostridium sp.]